MRTTKITDVLVLAAVDRAFRHEAGARGPRPVAIWAVCEHLGVSRRSRAACEALERLTALEGSALQSEKRRGVQTWQLTRAGKRRLSRIRSRGQLPVLPEAPQHKAWRETRADATERFEEFWLGVLDAIEHVQELVELPVAGRAPDLDAPPALRGPSSDAWFEAGERVQRACWRLASATYCLWEWPEPDDAQADVDDHSDPCDKAFDAKERGKREARRRGRRTTTLWDRHPTRVFFGKALCQAREQRNITPDELATIAGIGERRLARIETGKVEVDFQTLIKLARAMELKLADLAARAHKLLTEERPEE
jgi:ribosome-binding protein aMBF1 (putative translation factor)